MTQPFRKTFLPPNKFYSAVDIPSSADEAGASAPAPTPDAPAEILAATRDVRALALSSQAALANGFAPKEMLVTPSSLEPAAIDSCQEPVAADAFTVLEGAVSEPLTKVFSPSKTEGAVSRAASSDNFADDLARLLGVAGKPSRKPARRRLKLPPFAPDYEAMEAAMHNPGAPRALEGDPVWADPAPLFLRDA